MSGTLKVPREGRGIELLPRRQFEVRLDGAAVGSVAFGETVETQLEPGHHTHRIHAGRHSSRDQRL